ncbi:MAG: acetolactate synthase small subunit [Zetaproteobacteria bacterium]|nr:acetolactate synthase small subunit [Zetaproteobacteria bacterium]
MRHTITILVENEFGVLTRVAGLFSARGFNIESLNVAPTMDETVSRLTLVTRGSEKVIEQINKQLNKLIPVIKTEDISHERHIEREMLLVKVHASEDSRADVLRMVDIFHANVVDVSEQSYTLELTGDAEKLDDFLKMITVDSIIEMSRTGPLGMRRGDDGFVI